MTATPRVPAWFAAWHCHCTTLTRQQNDIPAACPEHHAPLLGLPEPADPAPGMPFGRDTAADCACPTHRDARPEQLTIGDPT